MPDGHRIQIGWLRDGVFPHMPFNGQLSFPTALELRSSAEGPRLFRAPIREIAALHNQHREWKDLDLKAGENLLSDVKGELFHIRAVIRPEGTTSVGFAIRGQRIAYNVGAQKLDALGEAHVGLKDGRLTLELLVDRATIEAFVNGGERAMSSSFLPTSVDAPLSIFSEGGTATIESLDVWTLKSTWPQKGDSADPTP